MWVEDANFDAYLVRVLLGPDGGGRVALATVAGVHAALAVAVVVLVVGGRGSVMSVECILCWWVSWRLHNL